MHLVTQSMIQFDKSFCNGGRGGLLDLPCTPMTISYWCQIVQLDQQKGTHYVETHGFSGNQ